MFIIIIATVFAASFMLVYAIIHFVVLRRDPVRARLEKLAGDARVSDDYNLQASLRNKGVDLLASNIQNLSSSRERLSRAGYHRHDAVYKFYMATFILSLVGLSAVAMTGMLSHLSTKDIVLMAGAGSVLGALLPRFYVSYKISKRREAIRQATPNMLDLLVVCVEAGLSFTAGIKRLSEEMQKGYPELAQELKIVIQEILIGKPKSDAFRMLANRTEVEELRALAVTLIQADRLGSSIGSALRVLADSMRFKRRQRAEEAANKVSVKLVFPLVLLIFPELLIVLVGPAMINVYRGMQDMAN